MKWLRALPIVLAVAVVIGAVTFVAANLWEAGRLPDGPVDVVWDREVCAHCRMHVGEPAFAAQLQTVDGEVLGFDDPGCAFRFLAATDLEVHAFYFRHHTADRWLRAERTAFVRVAQSPMGFGYGAVEAGADRAIPLAEVRARVLEPGSETAGGRR